VAAVTPEHWKRVAEQFEKQAAPVSKLRYEGCNQLPETMPEIGVAVVTNLDVALGGASGRGRCRPRRGSSRLLASDENAGTFMNSSPALGSLPVSDDHFAARLELLREENPSLARDLKTVLSEHQALGDEGFVKTEIALRQDQPGEAAQDSQTPLIGQRVGAYTLESPIGRGGMGTVWVARRSDGRFEGPAAVKFLNVELLGGAAEERFRREGTI
jgi:hypothetical protein